ncbi:MAG TPA: biotin/lipoyl-binding protein, partial [Pirellulaceae bacterium]|nr:biotin/lipoyl-binding protein [Pirellulaceae bacterium]
MLSLRTNRMVYITLFLGSWLCGEAASVQAQSSNEFTQFPRIEPGSAQLAVPSHAVAGRPDEVVLEKCGAHLIDEIELAALVTGQLEIINVERGAHIKAGDVIAQINDTLARIAVEESQARTELAEFQAPDKVPIEAAFKEIQLRKTQFDR